MKFCLVILFFVSALIGCGQKGDLFLEEPQQTIPPAQKKADQKKDEPTEAENQ